MGQEIALCKKCHGELSEQIVGNYKAMEKFAEGARFLEEFGRIDEAYELLASDQYSKNMFKKDAR